MQSNGIEVPASDDREYAGEVLANGLKVLVLSDPHAEKAAAGVSVRVGSFADPADVQGMAHFCEHLCFLGSAKYPGENDWSEWLARHGGSSNAYTASDRTVYFFDVRREALAEAVDRFSGFFVAPLMQADGVSRELQAVDAEHSKNVNSDLWRERQLDHSTSRPDHPYSQFSTGDSRTLRDGPAAAGVDVRARVAEFHASTYRAPWMCAFVVGSEPASELLALARAAFGAVRGLEGAAERAWPAKVPEDPFGAERTGLVQWMVPLRDSRRVTVEWAVPSPVQHWRTKPERILSHVLGHEGVGSLLSLLKRRGWATELMAGSVESNDSFALFAVGVELTVAGLERVDDVLTLIFAAAKKAQTVAPAQWIFDECVAVEAAKFRFSPRAVGMQAVLQNIDGLHDLPVDKALSGRGLYWLHDAALVADFAARLTPERARVRIQAKSFADRCDHAEPWYGTKFSELPFSAEQLAQFRLFAPPAELTLIEPNRFIATDFALRFPGTPGLALLGDRADDAEDDDDDHHHQGQGGDAEEHKDGGGGGGGAGGGAAGAGRERDPFANPAGRRRVVVPEPLVANDVALVYHHLDEWFGTPKVLVRASYALPEAAAGATPLRNVLAQMFVRMVQEHLNELSYEAQMAALSFQALEADSGLMLSVSGFNEKAEYLVRVVVDTLSSGEAMGFSDAEFENHRHALEDELRSLVTEMPVRLLAREASDALVHPTSSWRDQLRAVETLRGAGGAAQVREFGRALFAGGGFVRGVVYGNATRAEAERIARALQAPLERCAGGALRADQLFRDTYARRAALLPLGVDVDLELPATNAEEENAAAMVVYGLGGDTPQNVAWALLLAHMLYEPAFDQLRTKEQLGYIVQAGPWIVPGGVFLRVMVQSNRKDARGLVDRIDGFLHGFRAGALADLTDADLRQHVRAVLVDLQQEDSSLLAEARRVADCVSGYRFDWDAHVQRVLALRDVAPDAAAVRAKWDALLAPGGAERRRLALLWANGAPQAQAAQLPADAPVAPPRGPQLDPWAVLERAALHPALPVPLDGLEPVAPAAPDAGRPFIRLQSSAPMLRSLLPLIPTDAAARFAAHFAAARATLATVQP